MHERLAAAGGGELEQRLAQGDLAVGVRGLAAGGGHRPAPSSSPRAADDVHVGDAVRGGGELGHHVDARAAQPVEQGEGVGVGEPVGVDDDAAVDRAERDRVAVALQQLEQGVAEGALGVERGALAVGDDGGSQPPGGGSPGRSPGARRRTRPARARSRRRGGGSAGSHYSGASSSYARARLQAQRARVLDAVGALLARPGRGRTPEARGGRERAASTAASRPSRRARPCAPARASRRSPRPLPPGCASVARQRGAVQRDVERVEPDDRELDDAVGERREVALGRRGHARSSSGTGPASGCRESSRSYRARTCSVVSVRALEGREDGVEVEVLDHRAVVAELPVGERDLRVERLVRRQRTGGPASSRSIFSCRRRTARRAAVVQDAVPVEVAAGAVQHEAGGELEDVVGGQVTRNALVHSRSRTPIAMTGGCERVLELAERAVAVDVARGQHGEAAAATQLVEGLVENQGAPSQPTRPLSVSITQPRLSRPNRGAHQNPWMPGRPRPSGHAARGDSSRGEVPAVVGQGVADVGAHRARRRRGGPALPVAAVGAGDQGAGAAAAVRGCHAIRAQGVQQQAVQARSRAAS